MSAKQHVRSDEVRTLFSRALSHMYRCEVPQYGKLIDLVAHINARKLEEDAHFEWRLREADELDRLAVERHGAIRLGGPQELATMRRVFAVMGMHPVGYYDLSIAGVPVHATAFRPISEAALRENPFRVFTSLLRLELIEDESLRREAASILARRNIFTGRAIAHVEAFERDGGLTREEAEALVREVLGTFRWHSEATVSAETYKRLLNAHRLIADVVSFRGPHINHLTPRTLDIDAVQEAMPSRGIKPKAVIEGPSYRACPILLRQTSFKALEEAILFRDAAGRFTRGTHTARFGEVEQRGAALTPKGRALYDSLLAAVRANVTAEPNGRNAREYAAELSANFARLPDDWSLLRRERLAFFRYSATKAGLDAGRTHERPASIEGLLAQRYLQCAPIIYEDFLPVSAAGIFQSNLDDDAACNFAERGGRTAFEEALGAPVLDEFELYAQAERTSLQGALTDLGFAITARFPDESNIVVEPSPVVG